MACTSFEDAARTARGLGCVPLCQQLAHSLTEMFPALSQTPQHLFALLKAAVDGGGGLGG